MVIGMLVLKVKLLPADKLMETKEKDFSAQNIE